MFTEKHQARRGHLFVPPHDDTPGLYETEHVALADKVVRHHYFVGGCDWWVVELDRHQDLIWGFANINDPGCAEWGYSSLEELESLLIPTKVRISDGSRTMNRQQRRSAARQGGGITVEQAPRTAVIHLVVERDLGWQPTRAADIPDLAECTFSGVR